MHFTVKAVSYRYFPLADHAKNGNYTHNWTNNFANVNYGYVGTGHASAVAWLHSIYTGDPDASNRLTGSTNVQTSNSSNVLVDADITNYVAHGDLDAVRLMMAT